MHEYLTVSASIITFKRQARPRELAMHEYLAVSASIKTFNEQVRPREPGVHGYLTVPAAVHRVDGGAGCAPRAQHLWAWQRARSALVSFAFGIGKLVGLAARPKRPRPPRRRLGGLSLVGPSWPVWHAGCSQSGRPHGSGPGSCSWAKGVLAVKAFLTGF